MNEAEVYLKKLNYLESRIAFLERLERGFVEERGWIPIFQTAVYASPTSVTFANINLTAYLKIGVRCSWYQSSGWRYGYVLSSSYSVGNTTLNFVANTSFNVANTAISIFRISYGSPPDFPISFSYSPTVSAISGTFTTINSSENFSIYGRVLHYEIAVQIIDNGTASIGVIVSIPVTSQGRFVGAGRSATTGNMLQSVTENSTLVSIFNYNNTYPGSSGDLLYVSGTFFI